MCSTLNSMRDDIERALGLAGRTVAVREVLGLAWPIMVSMVSFTAMLVTDSIFVARLGTAPLAAIGLAGSTTFTLLAGALGLIRGTRVYISQRSGANDPTAVERALWQALWLALGLGLLTASAVFTLPWVFAWLGGSEEVTVLATGYTVVRLVGAPVTYSVIAFSAYFEGRGNTRTPMVAALIQNALNIALDPLLIFGIDLGALGSWGGLGMPGAAWATIIGGAGAAAYLAWFARERILRPTVRRGPDRRVLAAIWRLGSPMAARGLLEVGAWTVFTAFLARVGDAELAAHVLVVRVCSMSFLPGHAVGEAASVLVGRAVGARDRIRARDAWRSATLLACCVMAGCGLVFLSFPDLLIGIFEPTAEVAEVARTLLLIACAMQIADAVAMVGQGALVGAGDTRFVLWSSLAPAWLLNLPLAWLLAVELGYGGAGAWCSLTLEIAAVAAICVVRLRGDRWLDIGEREADREDARAQEESTPAVAVAA